MRVRGMQVPTRAFTNLLCLGKRQGQKLVLTVLCVPHSLDSGRLRQQLNELVSCKCRRRPRRGASVDQTGRFSTGTDTTPRSLYQGALQSVNRHKEPHNLRDGARTRRGQVNSARVHQIAVPK